MIVVSVEDLRKHYGPEPVLDGVTFEVRPGERIGLIGPNGSGKTTLLKILAGREEADGGRVAFHPDVETGYLEQQPQFAPDRTVWDEAHGALDKWIALGREAVQTAHRLSRATDDAEHRRLAARFDQLQHLLEHHDAYNLEPKVERVLQGVGFRPAQFGQPARLLSGGEQNRLLLARLLLAEPDLMLLDEPSNHLDIEATEWLEDYLSRSPAAMVLVSHDRYFLDRVTNRTLELFRGTVDAYAGNFSAYWRQKEERLLVQRRTYERQQTAIAKAEEFIRRNAYGQKHAQAEDRRKKLARVRRVGPPRDIAAPPMGFGRPARSGDVVVRAEGLAKSFDRPLFRDAAFQIGRGQRWAVLGPNGCGKTTLLRCLLGDVAPDAGRVTLGHALSVGYFDQRLAGIDETAEAADAVRPPGREMDQLQRRSLLARFGITGERALQRVGSLSGGERNRAALARLAALAPNFLVLDEPTNHLDIWARDALERSLREFPGTVLFVSHDRYFVNQVADHVLAIEPERVRVVEGNYDAYLAVAGRAPAGPSHEGDGEKPRGRDRPAPATASETAPRRKRRFPYRKLADLEAEIFQRETRLEELHAMLADPEVYRSGERMRETRAEIARQKQSLAQLYEHWEEAAELGQ